MDEAPRIQSLLAMAAYRHGNWLEWLLGHATDPYAPASVLAPTGALFLCRAAPRSFAARCVPVGELRRAPVG